jgi:hypothetical protein
MPRLQPLGPVKIERLIGAGFAGLKRWNQGNMVAVEAEAFAAYLACLE